MTQYFPRVAPEEVGISSAAVLETLKLIDKPENGAHGFMVMRHGKVAAEAYWAPYAAEKKHCLFSVSKSFTCMAVGFAV
ncbi:MAG: serine hydrolase, partial [Christensenellaceae bacterium]|nr:serine hydrolase [Christensenellaceae bacterium]